MNEFQSFGTATISSVYWVIKLRANVPIVREQPISGGARVRLPLTDNRGLINLLIESHNNYLL